MAQMRILIIGIGALMCAVTCVYASPGKRLPTLDDAFAVKSVGTIAANPKQDAFALETGGSITVMQAGGGAVSLPPSAHMPIWSPDGEMLAFYVTEKHLTQLAVWNRTTKVVRTITHKSDGISPNPWAGLNDRMVFTWSPDSRNIAFSSRSMPGFAAIGKPDSDEPIRVYDRLSSIPFMQLRGLFHVSDLWEALGGSADGDYAPARMRAVESAPALGR